MHMTMRCLVVANQTLGGTALIHAVSLRARAGDVIHIVVPATEPADEHASAGGTAAGSSQLRLHEALDRLRAAGVDATGAVGAADPIRAIGDALAAERYSSIVISTLPAGLSRWLHADLPHRAAREFELPVEWIEARSDSPDEATTVHIEWPR
jgi:GABA permease